MRAVPDLLLAAAIAASGPAAPSSPEASIAAAWRALHPGAAPPAACSHPDPVRQLAADLDPAPGPETALASLRYGVILISASGRPLGDVALGCGGPAATGASEVRELLAVRASGLGPLDLVARTRQSGRCGTIGAWVLLRRAGQALQPLLSVDEEVDRACGGSPRERLKGRVEVLRPGALRVTTEGTIEPWREDGYGPPEPVRRTARYELLPGGRFGLRAAGR